MPPKRARIRRGGKDFYLPVRTSDAERARDQELLNAIGKGLSVEEAEEAVEKIRRQRDSERANDENRHVTLESLQPGSLERSCLQSLDAEV